MIKKLLVILALAIVSLLSIACCTSSTSSNDAAANASQAASSSASETANTAVFCRIDGYNRLKYIRAVLSINRQSCIRIGQGELGTWERKL